MQSNDDGSKTNVTMQEKGYSHATWGGIPLAPDPTKLLAN